MPSGRYSGSKPVSPRGFLPAEYPPKGTLLASAYWIICVSALPWFNPSKPEARLLIVKYIKSIKPVKGKFEWQNPDYLCLVPHLTQCISPTERIIF